MTEKYIRDRLLEMQDLKYRDFHSKLMPTVSKDLVIGVRTPDLRKFAKEISETSYAEKFIGILPHKYYEENNLHAFLIELTDDFELCIERLNVFLPYVDNWATCDMMRPKVFRNHLTELLPHIRKWISSDDTYTVRFGIEMLMCYYLDDNYNAKYSDSVAGIRSDEYYVKMMQAWYFATALAKNYGDVITYLEHNKLDADTHNKTIRKAIESYRISDECKKYLRTLRRI